VRVLADESIPGDAVAALRGHGHDVAWVREVAPGARDDAILELARDEARVLITFDKDFGELAFRFGLPASAGIILFRLTLPSPDRAAQTIVGALETRDDWTGHFAVVEEERIRMTPLPGTTL
jgi:predicted nuclease of predicted toxin-antitoxin system